MKATVEPVEANKVKVSVEIDAAEFEKDVDAAFKRIAKEVKLPGFRPGKAPRKLLEARFGAEVGRQEALREALPNYYAKAVAEHEVDVIAAPSIDVTAGQDSGPVTFDAVVEVRPSISVAGYRNLRVEIPSPIPTDDEIDAQLDRLREQFATLETVERPIQVGDHVTIDIEGFFNDQPVPGLTASDYLYEIGRGAVVPEIDDNLIGAEVGDPIQFTAENPGAGDDDDAAELEFSIEIKQVQQKVLPDVDDDFARRATEFDTAAELRADLERNLTRQKRALAHMAVRARTSAELIKLVDDDVVPQAMIDAEAQERISSLVNRLRAQGASLDDYLRVTGRNPQAVLDEAKAEGAEVAKLDLALRAIGEAEGIEVTENDIDEYLEKVLPEREVDLETVRSRLVQTGQLVTVRSDILKSKALDWLVEQVEIVDGDGTVIDRESLIIDLDEYEGGDEPADQAANDKDEDKDE